MLLENSNQQITFYRLIVTLENVERPHEKNAEASLQRYSLEKVFQKHAANLQEHTHAEVWFQ